MSATHIILPDSHFIRHEEKLEAHRYCGECCFTKVRDTSACPETRSIICSVLWRSKQKKATCNPLLSTHIGDQTLPQHFSLFLINNDVDPKKLTPLNRVLPEKKLTHPKLIKKCSCGFSLHTSCLQLTATTHRMVTFCKYHYGQQLTLTVRSKKLHYFQYFVVL